MMILMPRAHPLSAHPESGNILIYILGAIVLMGVLVMLVKGSNSPGAGIDSETTMIRASEVQQYAGELERAVNFILSNNHSENDIRFAAASAPGAYGNIATDTPLTRQVFAKQGGAATYRAVPAGIQTTATPWQFYGNTHIKGFGTDTLAGRKAELIAVLPNVTPAFCERINELNGQNLNLAANHDPTANGCLFTGGGSEFTGSFVTGASANIIDHTLFTQTPAKQACIRCQTTGALHFYHVLLGR